MLLRLSCFRVQPSDGLSSTQLAPVPALAGLLLLAALVVACGADTKPPGSDAQSADRGQTSLFDAGLATDSGQADVATAHTTGSSSDDGTVVLDVSTGFDVSFPTTDAACSPTCSGKVCGPDGCGAVCGFCPSGKVCAADGSACQAFCKPDCTGKKCGDNGCGGSCGDCPKDYGCGVDFICHKNDCTPSCAVAGGGTKKCGTNGCGGTCGACAAGDSCADATGVCSATACKGIPAGGSCEGELLIRCDGVGVTGKKVVTDCALQVPKGDKICAYSPTAGKYACVKKPDCTPQCTTKDAQPKECGGDGCGGKCGGGCTAGWACPGGTCVAQKGATCGPAFPPAGQCQGTTWLYCSNKLIQGIDCSKAGQGCGWIAAQSSFGCK